MDELLTMIRTARETGTTIDVDRAENLAEQAFADDDSRDAILESVARQDGNNLQGAE